jgi:hypothetical protein
MAMKYVSVSLVQDQSERAGQRLLDGSEIDIAVALHDMAIAGREQRALLPNRKIYRRACDQFLVAAVLARLDRADCAVRWWRNAHDIEERRQRNLRSPRHGRDHAFRIERNVDDAADRKVLGQGP